MTELCQYVDVCISNEEDAKDVFGIEAENTDIYGGKLDHEGYKSVAKQLADKFGFEKVAITLRTSISASDNDWAGMKLGTSRGEALLFEELPPAHRGPRGRRRQLRRRPDLRAALWQVYPGRLWSSRWSLREALRGRRLQPRHRLRGGEAGRRRRLRPRPALILPEKLYRKNAPPQGCALRRSIFHKVRWPAP